MPIGKPASPRPSRRYTDRTYTFGSVTYRPYTYRHIEGTPGTYTYRSTTTGTTTTTAKYEYRQPAGRRLRIY